MEYIKVSFIGDIMCEKPLLKAARKDGIYDFEEVFSGLSRLFEKSDYVIGNLETVCAGEAERYTHELYSFNTPDSFIPALKQCGIDFVSTANNHCLDRGIPGLKRTLDILDSNGIRHTGTYRSPEEASEPCIVDIGGLRIGLIAYTYGTNPNMNGVLLNAEEAYCVDLLQEQESSKDFSFVGKMKGLVSVEAKTKLKKMIGKPYKNITVDHMPTGFDESYLKKLSESVERTKAASDYTVCLLHCGGQFNREPGEYSEFMMNYLIDTGVDSIIGNHPHNVQKSRLLANGIATYCLGNVSISPSSIYVPKENLPDYSIALHMYFQKERKTLEKITASVLMIEEKQTGYVSVFPVTDLYKKQKDPKILENTKTVIEQFMQRNIDNFQLQEEWRLA